MRQGKVIAKDVSLYEMFQSKEDSLITYIAQLYEKYTKPKEIIVPLQIEEILSELLEVKVINPKKGNKKKLQAMASKNAEQYFISDGDMAEVRTKSGKIQIKALLSNRVRPDTIHIPQGWEEANVNELTGSEDADPISGFPNLKSLRCGINKL